MILIQPNTHKPLPSIMPRSSTTMAETTEASNLTETGIPIESANTATTALDDNETTDTFTSSEKSQESTPAHPSKKTQHRKKALVKAMKDAEKQERLDNQEIHDAKVKTAWWTFVPFIGPLLGVLPNLASSPESLARKRLDVTVKDRPEDEAIEQEKKIKGAKLKAAFITSIPHIIGDIVLAVSLASIFKKGAGNSEERMATYIKNQSLVSKVFNWVPSLGLLAIPLGYQLFEKPDDPNFNKAL
jgi:hypothetical protein